MHIWLSILAAGNEVKMKTPRGEHTIENVSYAVEIANRSLCSHHWL